MILKMRHFIFKKFPSSVGILSKLSYPIRKTLSKIKINRLLSKQEEIFLEVGSGAKKGQGGWVTVDVVLDCDIFCDLRDGIPFPDNSLSKIYSSHFFEHLSYKEGQKFLSECIRALKPGGSFSICVPNAKLWIDAYENEKYLEEETFFVYKPAYNNTTTIDYINYIAYMDGQHKYMFDETNLIHILKSAGLKNVINREFDASIDLEDRIIGSIYAVGIK